MNRGWPCCARKPQILPMNITAVSTRENTVSIRRSLLLVTLVAGMWLPALVSAQQTYVEDFTTTTYKDTTNTTADWNTGAAQLKLHVLPQPAGSYNTPGDAYRVVVAGRLAYVADGGSGLQIINISNPTAPTLVGSKKTSITAYDVAVAGDLAFIADGTAGLLILDITDPTNPGIVGAYNTSGTARGVAVAGDLAWVADGDSGLQVIDISNPASPTLAGTYDTPGYAYIVTVAGDLAFVADGGPGLQIIDISDPTTPSLAGTFNTSGYAYDVTVAGDLAFVADGISGLQVIDISDPTTPSLTGTYDTPETALGVTVTGNLAFVADGTPGLVVVDITDPSLPTLAGGHDTPGYADHVAVVGDLAFVADSGSGLQIMTIRYPTPLTLVGTYDTPGYANDIAVAGDLVYVADNHTGLSVVDISDPANPALVGAYGTPDVARGIAVSGDLALVAVGGGGLQIIDISDPTTPTFVGSYDTTGGVWDVVVEGDHAFMAAGGYGLLIIDISDPANPTRKASWLTGGSAHGIAIAGNVAFVAAHTGGLKMVDISDPANPAAFGNYYDTPGYAYDVKVAGDLVYVADNTSGLHVIDISNIYAPTLAGTYDTPGQANAVVIEGDLAYVADLTSGLQVLRVYQHDVVPDDNVGQSLAVDGGTDAIARARLTSTETSGVSWELSANGGANWQAVAADNNWNRFTTVGDELVWRSTHAWALGLNPAVSDVTIEWRNEFARVASIADVPGDQGGRVYIGLTRSGYDFADETTSPVTQYGIYRRVDSAALIATVESRFGEVVGSKAGHAAGKEQNDMAPLPGIETVTIDGARYVHASFASGSFPPGTWALVKTVPATQSDSYLAEVTTGADSSAAGSNPSVYLVTTHTTTPSVWFVSYPDSGHSVDNLAPGVPQNLVAAYNTGSGNQLSWDPAPEPDFQYYRIYRDTDPNFVPSVANFVEGTVATNWTDPDNDGGSVYYKVAAVDHADNESDPASPGTATSVPDVAVPTAFALHQNYPNPFNPMTQIGYDVPRGGANVQLYIYDVSGQLVRSLADGWQTEGRKQLQWDGRNNKGQRVATGTYFYRLTAPSFGQTRKMVLLK